jgi:inhibitor of cysteine peptidase
MKKILTTLFIAFVLFACSVAQPTESPTAVPQPEVSDPAKVLEAGAGSEFNLVLDSSPTTGYHWEIVGELDAGIVEFISKDYSASQPVTVGSGGVDIFTFKALGAGEARITLGYYPPSNDPVEPQQIVTFTVTVK